MKKFFLFLIAIAFLAPMTSCARWEPVPCSEDPYCVGYEDPYYGGGSITDAGNNLPEPPNCHPAGIGCHLQSFEAILNGYPTVIGGPVSIKFMSSEGQWLVGQTYFMSDEAYLQSRAALQQGKTVYITSSIHYMSFGNTFEFRFVSHRIE